MIVFNLLTFKKTHLMKKLKIISKWTNMLYEREYYNTKDGNKLVQTIRKSYRSRQKKINTKSFKETTSKNQMCFLQCERIK